MDEIKYMPFDTAPRDGTKILAFNRHFGIWITIQFLRGYNTWITGTKSICWTDDSFTMWTYNLPEP